MSVIAFEVTEISPYFIVECTPRRCYSDDDSDDVDDYVYCDVGRLVAVDDADADITSRSRDTVRRHVLVRLIPQQHNADCAVCCRNVH